MVTFTRAATAASELFRLIDSASNIDPFDVTGNRPARIEGSIDIRGLTFTYPTRPDVKVLDDFSLHIPAGKVTALVVRSPPLRQVGRRSLEVFFREPVVLAKVLSSDCWKGGTTQILAALPLMAQRSPNSTYSGSVRI
jgi:hypothetical protein